jgi:hypothetical protein
VADSRIYLSGGPCNGRTVPASEIQGGLVAYIACGGGYYELKGSRRRPNGDLIFSYAGTTAPGPPTGSASGAGVAPQAHQGWGGLRRSINRDLPTALRVKARYQQAALRELAHRRRVHR